MMYHETVAASRWLFAILVPAMLGAMLALQDALRADGGAVGRTLTAGAMIVIIVVLLAVAFWFTRLRVSVDAATLHFSFGPIRRTVDGSNVIAVKVERYDWRRFGGWGIRFARRDKQRARAWTVPFLRSGVWVEQQDGTGYYISSRRADVLAAAISGIRGTRRQ